MKGIVEGTPSLPTEKEKAVDALGGTSQTKSANKQPHEEIAAKKGITTKAGAASGSTEPT